MTLVFTNGCFELVHPGHVDLLARARALGDRLVVGLNSDRSVRAIKGPERPVVSEDARAAVLRALRSVDEVLVFDEPTPLRLIETLRPDVLVKGGDWPIDQIVGADLVLGRGGRVLALPLTPGYSTSALLETILGRRPLSAGDGADGGATSPVARALAEHQETMRAVIVGCRPAIEQTAACLVEALGSGAKVILCGNGGSASDAEHIAAELVGRFEGERRPYPAVALTANTSLITAIGNDYGFERLFARQVEAIARPGDVLVALSTSGNSANVLAAVMEARRRGCRTIGLTGAGGKRLASLCDLAVIVPSARTSRVQEAHLAIAHIWCEVIDLALGEGGR